MKYLSYFLLIISFAGCVMSKDLHKFNFDSKNGIEPGEEDFIEMNDGTIKYGSIDGFKFNLGLINKNKSNVRLRGIEYPASDIRAFQMGKNYYRKPAGSKTFLQRLKVGLINMYYEHITRSGTDSRGRMYNDAYDLHYLQKGGVSAPIQKFSLKLLEEMVSDNTSSMKFISKYKNTKKDPSKDLYLDKAINIYNGDVKEE